MDHPFRSATFGGFNRQDVLNYLEKSARDEAKRQEELAAKAKQASQEAERCRTALSEEKAKLDSLTADNAALRRELEQVKAELAAQREENSKKAAQLTGLEGELAAVRGKLSALEPDAMAYAAVKDRTAGVELEAHRRAKEIQAQAEEQAQELRRQMGQWFKQVEKQYDALRGEVESTVAYAAEQLGKAGAGLEQVVSVMGEQNMKLSALEQAYADTELPRFAPNGEQ